MSSMVSPASAIAASQAATVSDSGATINRRPISDMPIPVSATLSSNFSGVSIGRTYSPKRSGAISSTGKRSESRRPSTGRNSGSQTSSMLLEDDLDLLAEFQLVGIAVDDVGGQPHPGVLGDGDLRDDVGRRQPGQAESFVDR